MLAVKLETSHKPAKSATQATSHPNYSQTSQIWDKPPENQPVIINQLFMLTKALATMQNMC